MEKYYKCRPQAQVHPTTQDDGSAANSQILLSEYDRYRQTLLQKDDDEGWPSELRRYLSDRPVDVTKDTDVVEWWQVRPFFIFFQAT